MGEDEPARHEHRPGDEAQASQARDHPARTDQVERVPERAAEDQCAAGERRRAVAAQTDVVRKDERDARVRERGAPLPRVA